MNINDTFFAYWNELEQHKGWVDLGMGMPPISLFPPAYDLQPALIHGLSQRADYQPQAGSLNLRKAIAEYESRRTGIDYKVDNIMLVAGAIRGFSLILDTITTPFSTLIEIIPTYPLLAGYARHTAKKLNCRILTITPRNTSNFSIEADEILPHIHRSSILYLTNPSNPTGKYMSRQVFSNLINICKQTDSYMLVDESCDIPYILKEINYQEIDTSSLIRIQSFSKNILLAGLRAGYIVTDSRLIEIFSQHYAFSDANAPLIFNKALIQYFRRHDNIQSVIDVIKHKIYQSVDLMRNFPRIVHIIEPEGCYYIFLKIDYPRGSWELFKYLLGSGVNVVPGVIFGLDDRDSWIRICCAHEDDVLTSGLNRLKTALELL